MEAQDKKPEVIAERLVIEGRVQGVGYRDWMVRTARRLGLSGWVRNRADGTVEALVHGPADDIVALVEACRVGPPAAAVTATRREPAAPPDRSGFHRAPTA